MDQTNRIYLDYAASTPVDPDVFEAMRPFFNETFGNPSSVHFFGQESEAALTRAREMVANHLNCQPDEVIFTGSGSESDNLALRGAALAARQTRNANHILITPVEHHAVSHTAQQLSKDHGFEIEYLPVDEYGMVNPADVEAVLREDTAVVSVIYANNEIGTINPIEKIGEICRRREIIFHTDAVQAGAYLSLDCQRLQVDLMALGAHKFYGPKGVGVLYCREGTQLHPILTGGGQEFGIRPGTHNVPLIIGFATALQLASERRQSHINHVRPLRDQVIGHTLEEIPDSRLTGHPIERLPNHTSFVLKGVDGNALLTMLDMAGFACSSGSACKTGSPKPSEVILTLGIPPAWALGSVRITLGNPTSPEDVHRFISRFPAIVAQARRLAN